MDAAIVSEAECERAFSYCKLTIGDLRHNIDLLSLNSLLTLYYDEKSITRSMNGEE